MYNQTKTPTKIIRELDCIYSPGTYISPEEKVNNITNNIMCIWMETIKTRNHEKVIYGLSVINIFTYTIVHYLGILSTKVFTNTSNFTIA